MSDLSKIDLTDDDRNLISQLVSYPYKCKSQIMRRNRKENPLPEEKLVCIEDISVAKLKGILPKIDTYIKELFELRYSLGSYDEMWVFEYLTLKDKIAKKIGEI